MTFRDFQVAAYEAGIGGLEFYDMTISDISRKIEASRRTERSEWERARLISYFAVSPYLDKNSGGMEKVIPFEWDAERKAKKIAKMKPQEVTDKQRRWLEGLKKYMEKQEHG